MSLNELLTSMSMKGENKSVVSPTVKIQIDEIEVHFVGRRITWTTSGSCLSISKSSRAKFRWK